MLDTPVIEQFERRLVELGCPGRRLQEKVRELGDHYQDLRLEVLSDGVSEQEADARAAALLGNPVTLAEDIVLGLRDSSWWGRHPFIGLCLLPPLVVGFLWAGCVYALYGIWRSLALLGPAYDFDQKTISALCEDPESFGHYAAPLSAGLDACSFVILTVGCCMLARRSAAGLRWMLATCAACLLSSLSFFSSIQPHNVTVIMGWPSPHWPNAAIPATAALIALVRRRRQENLLRPIPPELKQARAAASEKGRLLGKMVATPTYWVMAVLVALGSIFAIEYETASHREESRKTELKNKIWPAERSATLARLKEGQHKHASGRETIIDLKPWLNAALTATTDGGIGVKENNLAELPAGIQTFAGVPFDVEGRAQLLGQALIKAGKKFSGAIKGIIVGRKCDSLQLLHGASNVHALHKKIATLVLHYKNGTTADIGIISGEHLLDWWGPIYSTSAGDALNPTTPGTELAWAGENPWIKKREPENSLRLYKSSFANPHPELEIASIDYSSSLADAAPFLVGLTVEQSTKQSIIKDP